MVQLAAMLGVICMCVGSYELARTLLGFQLSGAVAFLVLIGGVALSWVASTWGAHRLEAARQRERERKVEMLRLQNRLTELALELKRAGLVGEAQGGGKEMVH